MFGIILGKVFHSKVIDAEGKGILLSLVIPEPGCLCHGFITMGCKGFDKFVEI